MTVKELKEKIKDLPDNMDVMIEQTNDEFQIGLANEASVIKVAFLIEDDGGDEADRAVVDAFVIRD